MRCDLHVHTTASDGTVTPAALITQACETGIGRLAISDHDTLAGYDEAAKSLSADASTSLELIPGIELSTQWEKTGIHVLGLNFNPASDAIRDAVCHQQNARQRRAERIAEKLEKLGIPDPLAGASRIAGAASIGRPHFAQYLVESGIVASTEMAFKKHLGAGKAGDVREFWPSMPQIIEWIRDAGGTAVLAHPAKYNLTRSKLVRLIDTFRDAGGLGMEVISGAQSDGETARLAKLCNQMNLLGSAGSDFHRPGQRWAMLGQVPPIPGSCTPVWDQW